MADLTLCIDYIALNALTLIDRYPLPRVDDVLTEPFGAKVRSHRDLMQGYYHHVSVAEPDIAKTAFRGPDGFVLRMGCRVLWHV